MIQLILTILLLLVCIASLLITLGLASYVPKLLETKINDFKGFFAEMEEKATENVKEMFTDPTVSRAMGIIGKKSGEVRADKALRNKVVDKITENVPSIKYATDFLGITPMEGLQLLNDPILGPFIRGFLEKGQGLGGGSLVPQGTSNPGNQVPEMR